MEKDEKIIYIKQNIEYNYGTANIAQGNINSVNNVIQNDIKEIIDIIDNLKRLLKNKEIDNDIQEEALDDLETIEEQVQKINPKYIKLKKACQGIKKFISKIPLGLTEATLIVNQLTSLNQKLEIFIDKFK